jgi:hypothetical protein
MKAKWRLIVTLTLLVASVGGVAALGWHVWSADTFGWRYNAIKDSPPLSREVMLVAQGVIKEEKPAPTIAARAYAYTSTVYALVRQQGTEAEALQASTQMLTQLFPAKKAVIKQKADELAKQHGLQLPTLAGVSKDILKTYGDREKKDGVTQLVWDGTMPKGEGKWAPATADQKPVTPLAGEWQRWLVSGDFTVPAPPVLRSAEDVQELAIVQQAVSKRDGAGVALVNFWGGAPGTETPAGIWQNQMWATIKDDLGYKPAARDQVYARLQMVLAQSLADSFMECWNVKNDYWTARPSMRIQGLNLAMDNPPFPGYPSGHATVSQTAADILTALAPQHRTKWQQMSQDAGNSRIIAGIHFDIDTKAGNQLGADVAKKIIETQKLTPLLK